MIAEDPVTVLLLLWGFGVFVVLISNLLVKWKLWTERAKWATDDFILAHEEEIEECEATKGKSRDMWHRVAAAIAKRDWRKNQRKLEISELAGALAHWLTQGAIIFFVYNAYVEDNLKLLVLLVVLFLWRSGGYRSAIQERLQTIAMARLTMASPNAEADFFQSEHCYGEEVENRAWEMLNKKGHFKREPSGNLPQKI